MKSSSTSDEPAETPTKSRPLPPAPAGTDAVTVTGLSLWYGKNQALFDVSVHVPAKKATAIIGPSGCGKSTLLRALNRMHEVNPGIRTSGSVTLFGQEVYSPQTDPTILRRRVGMVFQKSNPFPTMSIRDNVLVGLKLNGLRDRRVLDQRLEECLRASALWDEVRDRLELPGISLSGGQQQRLCIARAIALQPEVLLMDEPCSALDPRATAKIEELISALKRDFTIIIVTHNMQQASRVSDYTLFMYLGRVVEFGETEKIFKHPDEKHTEDYITGRFG